MAEHSITINKDLQGKWVIILDDNIITSGSDVKKLLEKARREHPRGRFILARVPEEGTLIY